MKEFVKERDMAFIEYIKTGNKKKLIAYFENTIFHIQTMRKYLKLQFIRQLCNVTTFQKILKT